MKNRGIYKYLYKVALFTLSIFVFVGLINVNAGYIYNSKNEPVYSTDGFTVNSDPYTYVKLGLTTAGAVPEDLFVYNSSEKVDGDILVPELIYLTDSGLDGVYVYNTDFELIQSLSTFRLVPDKLYATSITEVRTRNASGFSSLMFTRSTDVPSQEELDDPNGEYGGKGYIELKLNNPSSVYRAYTKKIDKDLIYICDKGNNQVVIVDAETYDPVTQTYEIYQILTKPDDEFEPNEAFLPTKIVTDAKGRMYVIADSVGDEVIEGILQFSIDGKFQRYTGTNETTLSAWEIFWRNLASETQLDDKSTLYNTTFNSLVYSNDMIYTTSFSIKNSDGTINDKVMIKRINPTGGDTLARNGYAVPKGDVTYSNSKIMVDSVTGPSRLVGITVNGYEVYSVVDEARGRIFTYDKEGNLLYISGGKGTQADKLNLPVAIQYFGENILVLDQNNKTIVKFEPTEIAGLINNAVRQENKARQSRPEPKFNYESNTWWIDEVDTKIGNENASFEEIDGYWWIDGKNSNIKAEELAATDYWMKVIAINANYEYAYVGIGHKYLSEGKYEEAMRYFKLGKNTVYYSKAYKQHRDAIIEKWFTPVVITIAVLWAGSAIYKKYRNKKLGIRKEEETGVGDE